MHRVLYHTRALPPAAIADASQASALTANVAGGGDPTYGRRSETQVDVAGSDFPSSSSSDDDRQSSDFGGTPPESDSVDSSTFGCVST
jgi:hypothetical protein